ncbi:MAG: hypothetical protein ACLGSD_02090 [Acidobacteriota bacterium]
MPGKNGVSAWLITEEWSGDHAKPEKPLIEILDPRMSASRVREIVEMLYQRQDSLNDKIAWRLRRQPVAHPAECPFIEGVRWGGQILCGHNPWLFARRVDDLVVRPDADGKETATWKERCSAADATAKIRRLKAGPLK